MPEDFGRKVKDSKRYYNVTRRFVWYHPRVKYTPASLKRNDSDVIENIHRKGSKVYYDIRGSRRDLSRDFYSMILKKSYGLTPDGMEMFQESSEVYVRSVLGAQADTRWKIVGDQARSYQTQEKVYSHVHNLARLSPDADTSNLINEVRKAVDDTNVRLDYCINPGIILLPSKMIYIKDIPGYNNTLVEPTDSQHFGFNSSVNTQERSKSTRGERGQKGDRGEKGEQGDQGFEGLEGEKGTKGTKGERGDVGRRGERGYHGTRGLEGPVGPKGERGDKGLVGPKGEQGVSGSFAGRGDKGSKGEQGMTGKRGKMGLHGTRGATGDRGEKGDRGDRGFEGLTGRQGDRGLKGNEGMSGKQGEKGSRGQKGRKGSLPDLSGYTKFEDVEDILDEREARQHEAAENKPIEHHLKPLDYLYIMSNMFQKSAMGEIVPSVLLSGVLITLFIITV